MAASTLQACPTCSRPAVGHEFAAAHVHGFVSRNLPTPQACRTLTLGSSAVTAARRCLSSCIVLHDKRALTVLNPARRRPVRRLPVGHQVAAARVPGRGHEAGAGVGGGAVPGGRGAGGRRGQARGGVGNGAALRSSACHLLCALVCSVHAAPWDMVRACKHPKVCCVQALNAAAFCIAAICYCNARYGRQHGYCRLSRLATSASSVDGTQVRSARRASVQCRSR